MAHNAPFKACMYCRISKSNKVPPMYYVTYHFFMVKTTEVYCLSIFFVGVPLFTKGLCTDKLI